MLNKIFQNKNTVEHEENHWLSVSDLMAGLMMVFLFISIVLMRNALIERDKIKEIAAAYQDNKVSLYNELVKEFKHDLPKWHAEINKKDLSFNFKSPEVLFDVGRTSLKPKFKEILNNFFPRYLKVIKLFKDSVDEVRIEGHTSTKWYKTSHDESYFKNMRLSQGRTRSVLSHVYFIGNVVDERKWIKSNVAAVGYSFSKLILKDGVEDSDRSRRVAFRVVTNSETEILKILGR